MWRELTQSQRTSKQSNRRTNSNYHSCKEIRGVICRRHTVNSQVQGLHCIKQLSDARRVILWGETQIRKKQNNWMVNINSKLKLNQVSKFQKSSELRPHTGQRPTEAYTAVDSLSDRQSSKSFHLYRPPRVCLYSFPRLQLGQLTFERHKKHSHRAWVDLASTQDIDVRNLIWKVQYLTFETHLF